MSARRLAALIGVCVAASLTACGNSEQEGSTAGASAATTTPQVAVGADGRPLPGATAAAGALPPDAVAVPANQRAIQEADRLVQCLTQAGRQASYESAGAYEMPTTEMTAALRAGDGGTVVEVQPSTDSDGEQGPAIDVFLLGEAARAPAFGRLLDEPENLALFAQETGQKDFETGYRLKTDPDIGWSGDAVVVSSDFLIGKEEQLFTERCGLGKLSDD